MKFRAYEIALNSKYDGFQRGLANMVYTFFNKKAGWGVNVNELLPQELHKLEFERIKKVNYVLGLKMVIGQQIKLKGIIIFF